MGELLKLLMRNALRHKLRSALTILGLGVAVMAFALLSRGARHARQPAPKLTAT